MKKIFFSYFFVITLISYGQEIIPFKVREQNNFKGGLKMIGNNILNRNPANTAYTGDEANDQLDMQYVDIDNDSSTFSSSAATLSFANTTCSKIRYAGLYWGGMYNTNDATKKTSK